MPKKRQSRRPGEGSVYQRADGRWVFEITLEDHTRKQYYFKTERQALEKRRSVLNELSQGVLATGPQQTVKQFLEYWLEDVYKLSVRVTTYRNCRIIVNKHLIPGLGHIKLQKLTTQQVQSFYAKKLKEGATLSRVKNIHVTLHTALDYARRARLVSFNVSNDVRLPGRKRTEKQVLTLEQARMVLQMAGRYRLEGILTLAIATGMREGELLGLRWSNIDLQTGVLRIVRTMTYTTGYGFVEGEPKTESSRRTIVLDQFVLDVLKCHRMTQLERKLRAGARWVDHDLVFPNRTGGFLLPVTLLRQFRRLLRQAGLPNMRFHDLRHSAATLLLSMGVEMKVIQELLGHSSITITADTYAHVLPATLKEAMDKMGRFLDSGSD